jgi:hypothetical protein
MDFSPPQGAHTRYLRTLSKIVCSAPRCRVRCPDVSSERAAYLTSLFHSVNTSPLIFSSDPALTFDLPSTPACHVAVGGEGRES